jgi:hypothetical protein
LILMGRQPLTFLFLAGLFLLVGVVGVNAAITPLICTTRADAVALIAGACELKLDCRYELGSAKAGNGLSLDEWDVLLTDQAHLLSASYTDVDPEDARYRWDYPAYITDPLVSYDPANLSGSAVDCAALLQASQVDPDAALVPDAVFEVLAVVSKFQRDASESAQCSDVNEVWVWTNATGTPKYSCQCAQGKVCEANSATVSSVVGAVGIFVAVLALGLVVFEIVVGSLALRQAGAMEARTPSNSNSNSIEMASMSSRLL